MPSDVHEWFLELFRNRSDSAADLLRNLDVALPEFDQVRIESPDVNSLKPVEYRADLVIFLARGSRYVLGIIVEVQLRRDERKCYAWPAYVGAKRIVETALAAVREINDERGDVYLDFIYSFLNRTPEVLEDPMTSVAYKYKSDILRRSVMQGIAEGETKGRLELILEQLAIRFGPVPDSIRTRIGGATAAQMFDVGKRVLTAQTLEEALGALD